MSDSNKKPEVDFRLKNLTNALYLTEGNDVALRTGITGDIIIEGSVSIPGEVTVSSTPSNPVHTHVSEVGTSGILAVPYMPVGGTVALDSATLTALENINATVSGTVEVTQGTDPWTIAGEVTVSNQATDIVIADSNYEMNIARGLIPGQSVVTRSSLNPSVSQNTETSVWVEGGIYPHGTWTTAQRLFVVSDNAADTGQTIFIEGLDAGYNYQTTQVTTNGTTGVLTTPTFIRIFTATIISASNNSANAGEIRFRLGSVSGAVVAHIGAGFGTTKLSQYTIPAGYTGYILYGDATTFRGGSGNIGSQVRMMIRPFGGAFVLAFVAEVVNGYYRNDFKIPLAITEKSDIDVRILADANNTVASCNYQLILIPNT